MVWSMHRLSCILQGSTTLSGFAESCSTHIQKGHWWLRVCTCVYSCIYWALPAPLHWLLTSCGEQLRGQKRTKTPPAVSICQRLTVHLLGARQTFCPPDCRTGLLSVSPVCSHSWRDAGGDRDIFCSDTSRMSRSAIDSCRSLPVPGWQREHLL